MKAISAKDLKTNGISAIEQALQEQDEAIITVCGQAGYVVMRGEQHRYLRECELEAALARSKADMNAGYFVKESVAQHLLRLKKLSSVTPD